MNEITLFIIATFISVTAVFAMECAQRKSIRVKITNILIPVLISDMVMGSSYLIFRDVYTRYEFIFINIAVALLCEIIIIPVISKRKIGKKDVLTLICVESCIVAFYSIFTYGQTIIHSDTATATLLSESILKHHSFFPRTWNYVNGDIWVLNNGLFCILPTMFMKNQSLARMIGSSVFLFITLGGMVYQSKKMFRDESFLISIPLIVIFLFASNDMILYQAAYTGQILWIAVCPLLLCEACKKKDKKRGRICGIIYSIITILLLMGGIRMAAEQTVPLLGAILIVYIVDIIQKVQDVCAKSVKNVICVMCRVIIPSAIGYGIYIWLTKWHNVNNTVNNEMIFVSDLSTVGKNITNLMANFYACFGYVGNVQLISFAGIRNLISIVLATMICFVIPFLQYRKIKSETKEIQFFCAFGLVHNIIMVILAVFTGKAASMYLLTSVFVFIMIAAHYIYQYWLGENGVCTNILLLCFLIATVVESFLALQLSKGWENILRDKKEFNEEIIARGLDKGYATYWNAYTNEVYSDLKIKYAGVNITDTSITPFKWLVDEDAYDNENKNTFLLLDEAENQQLQPMLGTIYPSPIDSFTVGAMYVYVFDHDLAIDICTVN